MIVLIWILCVLIIVILFGEIRFRQLKTRKKSNGVIKTGTREWSDSIDSDIDILDVEMPASSIIPSTILAKRGSWRLAQDLVLNVDDFTELSACEYSKVLR